MGCSFPEIEVVGFSIFSDIWVPLIVVHICSILDRPCLANSTYVPMK